MYSEQTRQAKRSLPQRQNLSSYNNHIQSQNSTNTQSYQPNQMLNEFPLLYLLLQHEVTKTQLTRFSQIPNAAESLQMTLNLYLMGESSISSNKKLLIKQTLNTQ